MIIYVLFNKSSGKYIGFTLDSNTINDSLLYRRVEVHEHVNIADIKWVGDYDTGKLVKMTDLPAEVSEYDLEEKLYDRFFRKYSFEDVTRLLMLQFVKLLDGNILKPDDLEPDFNDMVQFFKKLFVRHLKEIESFESSKKHVFVTKNQIHEKFNESFQVSNSNEISTSDS